MFFDFGGFVCLYYLFQCWLAWLVVFSVLCSIPSSRLLWVISSLTPVSSPLCFESCSLCLSWVWLPVSCLSYSPQLSPLPQPPSCAYIVLVALCQNVFLPSNSVFQPVFLLSVSYSFSTISDFIAVDICLWSSLHYTPTVTLHCDQYGPSGCYNGGVQRGDWEMIRIAIPESSDSNVLDQLPWMASFYGTTAVFKHFLSVYYSIWSTMREVLRAWRLARSLADSSLQLPRTQASTFNQYLHVTAAATAAYHPSLSVPRTLSKNNGLAQLCTCHPLMSGWQPTSCLPIP